MGLYYTFMAIVALGALLDFGFGPSVARNAAFAKAGAVSFRARGISEQVTSKSANWELLEKLLLMAKLWYFLVGVALFLLLAILGGITVSDLISRAELSPNLLFAWLLFAAATAFGFSTTFWQNLLIGIGEVRTASIVGVAIQGVSLFILVVALLLGFKIWAYVLNAFIAGILSWLIFRGIYLRRTVRFGIRITWSEFTDLFQTLWPMTWRQGVVMLGAFLIQRGNTLICSVKLGLDETASYGLSLTLLAILFQLSLIPVQLSMPRIGQLRVSGDLISIRQIFFPRLYLGLGCSVMGIIVLLFFGNPCLSLIGSKTHLLSTEVLLLLSIVWWLENHHSQYAILVLSENENPFIWPAVISGIFVFGLSWYAAGLWGVAGLIAAQGLVQAVWNNWWTVLRGIRGVSRHNLGTLEEAK